MLTAGLTDALARVDAIFDPHLGAALGRIAALRRCGGAFDSDRYFAAAALGAAGLTICDVVALTGVEAADAVFLQRRTQELAALRRRPGGRLSARRPAAYFGRRQPDGECTVIAFDDFARDGRRLPPRLDLANGSPSGFDWGYRGASPAQLALALLADYLGDDSRALALYEAFAVLVVAGLDRSTWALRATDIDAALARIAPR